MVTLATARTTLATQRSDIESRRQQIARTRLPELTAAQVRSQTRQSIIARQAQETDLARRKAAAVKELEPLTKQLGSFAQQIQSTESAIASQKKQEADFKVARKLFIAGTVDPAAPASVKKFLRDFQVGREIQIGKALKDIEAPLFTPLPQLFTPLPPEPQLFTPLPPEQRIPEFERTTTQKAIEKFGSKIQGKIEQARVSTLKLLSPSFRREANLQIRENEKVQNSFNNINKDIERFDNKFKGKELNQIQFSLAQTEEQKINEKIQNFNELIEETKGDQEKRLAEEQKLGVFKPFTLGVVGSPFTLGSFAVGLLTKPGVEKEFVEEVKALPSAFREAPVTTTGTLLGQLVGTAITFKLLGGLTSQSNLLASKKPFISGRTISKSGVRKTPLSETFKTEVTFKINENQIRNFARQELNKKGISFNKLSPTDQNFIIGQIKAKIINNPELFIPKASRIALQRQGVKNIKSAIKERLEGRADPLIEFDTLGKPKPKQQISEIQRLSLQRLQENLERQRVRRVGIERIERPLERPFDLLSKSQKTFFVEQIKARVKADPRLTLTNAQRIALENIKTKTQLKEVRTAILQGLEPKKVGDILSLSQRRFIKSQIETELRRNLAKFIPKQRQLALNRFQKLQEQKAIKIAKDKGAKNLKLSDLISKADKDFIKGQIDAQIRTQPQRFIPETRQVALQILKPRVAEEKVVFRITPDGRTSPAQKIALQRIKNVGIPKRKIVFEKTRPILLAKKKVIGVVDLKGIPRMVGGEGLTESQLIRARGQVGQFIIAEEVGIPLSFSRQIQEVKSIAANANRGLVVLKQSVSQNQKFITSLKTQQVKLQKKRLSLATFSKESQKLLDQQKLLQQKLNQAQKQSQRLKLQLQTFPQQLNQVQQFKLNQIERQRIKEKILERPKARILGIPFQKKKRKDTKFIRVPLKEGGFNVFVKSKGEFRKVNINPLRKKKARDLGAFLTDKSTARTFKIKRVGFKAEKPIVKVPTKYFSKNRRKFRGKIIKGKLTPLKNLAIEKRKFAIDSPGEKKQLSVARVRANILKKLGLRKIKKSPVPKLKSTRLIKLK